MKKFVPDPPVQPTSPRRYMPLTSNDCTIPALLADTEAPLDVLHEAATHRIRAATQLLESIAQGNNAELGEILEQGGVVMQVVDAGDAFQR